ncbi:hypothetical protein ACFSM5_21740 [Lacibacterium aquatile]|uniref:Uncharacterized protein n=1 Tax=Lacibacterium aquatile TaxID=1168082 RepID=A0ABW5E223_9PROT
MFDPFVHQSEALEGALAARDRFLRADYLRIDEDLMLVQGGQPIHTFHDYFKDRRPEDIEVPPDYRLPAALIEDMVLTTSALNRAQAGDPMAEIAAIENAAICKRIGETRTPLRNGQLLQTGDLIETGAFSIVELVLATSLKLCIGPMSRLRLDRRSLAPTGTGLRVGSIELTLMTGSVVSLASPTGAPPAVVTLRTPLGWLSWSDATMGAQIAAGDEPDTVGIIRQASGPTGAVTLVNDSGTQVLPVGPCIVPLNGHREFGRPLRDLGMLDDYGFAALLPSRRVRY